MIDRERLYEKIKNARLKRFRTNFYSADVINHANDLWELGDEFLFSYDDHGIDRLIFFAEDYNNTDKLLNLIDGGKYFIEFITDDLDECTFSNAHRYAVMLRLANKDCRSVFEANSDVLRYKDTAVIDKANASDAEEINKILWDTFRTEISHLLTDEELREKIASGQFTVHRNENHCIDALLQADVMPKKFYINQVVNRTEKNVVHAILLNRLKQYVEAGGKYLYAWVESDNIASLRFHNKYGMMHDGKLSVIYCLER